MKQHIYADNAATTKLDKCAFEAMIPWLTEEYGNPSQPYSFSRATKKALANARETVAACINADPDEIFFTSGGTESDNWAIKCAALANSDKKRIITTPIEHHAVLNTCKALSDQGFTVGFMSVNADGMIIQPDLLHKLCEAPTSVVSIMMANNEIGTLQPFTPKTESIIHGCGALFHTDAVQAVGHISVDVKKIGVDMLSASAHKFNGPRGIGFLYIKKGTHIYPFMNGGSQEMGMRAGTENVAGIVGMAAALKSNCDKLEDNQAHIQMLEEHFIDQIGRSGLDFVRNGSERHLPGLINLSFKGQDGEAILHRLDLMGISISTGSACDSVNAQVSHVIKAISVPSEYEKGTIRISFGKYNTEEEAGFIAGALKKALNN